jgi:hypothetical protein
MPSPMSCPCEDSLYFRSRAEGRKPLAWGRRRAARPGGTLRPRALLTARSGTAILPSRLYRRPIAGACAGETLCPSANR